MGDGPPFWACIEGSNIQLKNANHENKNSSTSLRLPENIPKVFFKCGWVSAVYSRRGPQPFFLRKLLGDSNRLANSWTGFCVPAGLCPAVGCSSPPVQDAAPIQNRMAKARGYTTNTKIKITNGPSFFSGAQRGISLRLRTGRNFAEPVSVRPPPVNHGPLSAPLPALGHFSTRPRLLNFPSTTTNKTPRCACQLSAFPLLHRNRPLLVPTIKLRQPQKSHLIQTTIANH